MTQGKSRFGTSENSISVGEIADLSLFNPDESYVFDISHITSKSKNSAFIGQNLKGKVYGIIANNKIVLK